MSTPYNSIWCTHNVYIIYRFIGLIPVHKGSICSANSIIHKQQYLPTINRRVHVYYSSPLTLCVYTVTKEKKEINIYTDTTWCTLRVRYFQVCAWRGCVRASVHGTREERILLLFITRSLHTYFHCSCRLRVCDYRLTASSDGGNCFKRVIWLVPGLEPNSGCDSPRLLTDGSHPSPRDGENRCTNIWLFAFFFFPFNVQKFVL